MDRPMMGREGGGGPRYIMPRYEDGSTYGPGDEFYDYVRDTYPIEEWNALPDDVRGNILDRFQEGASQESAPLPLGPSQGRPQLDQTFQQMDRGASSRSLRGLFGGGEERPRPKPMNGAVREWTGRG